MLGTKKGACSSEAASLVLGTVRLGMPVKDPSFSSAAASERKPALYEVLLNDELRAHFRYLRSAVDSGDLSGTIGFSKKNRPEWKAHYYPVPHRRSRDAHVSFCSRGSPPSSCPHCRHHLRCIRRFHSSRCLAPPQN